MSSFFGFPEAFLTCKTAFQRLSAWVHMEPNFLAFECIRLLLNVLIWLLEGLPNILRALLVFGNNLYRVMLPVLHFQTFLTFGSSFLYIKVMKKNSPQKHFFRHKVRHIWVKKLLLFTLPMNDIYWKRCTMTVAFQRIFGILERWNNNQVTLSLSKPHELRYRSNRKPLHSNVKKYITVSGSDK